MDRVGFYKSDVFRLPRALLILLYSKLAYCDLYHHYHYRTCKTLHTDTKQLTRETRQLPG